MNSLKEKEKILGSLVEKVSNLSLSYSQSSVNSDKIKTEQNQLEGEKKVLEKNYEELLREHKYLKEKILRLQDEIKEKSSLEKKFNNDIDELNQETQNLVEEIEKWQM